MTEPTSPRSTYSGSFEPVDLHTTPLSLARAVLARRAEYVRPSKIRVKIGSWNVAACPGTDKDLARWFVEGKGVDEHFAALDYTNPAVAHGTAANTIDEADSVRLLGGNDIGLYVLGLQEIVDLNTTKEYMNRAVNIDNSHTDKWQAALEAAMPAGYELVMSEQMTGLLLLIYASPEIFSTISNVSTKQIGTGLLGYFGNKGAVSTRIVLGETTRLVFVNCHLASGAGNGNLDRRIWDVDQIITKTKFDPVIFSGVSEDDGEMIGAEDFAFWFGDLNFRLDGLPGDDIRRLLTLHSKGEYGLGSDQTPHPPEGDGVIVMRGSESDDDTTVKSSVHSREPSFGSEMTLPDPDDFPDDPSQDPTSLQATLDSLLPHDQLRQMIAQRKVFHDGWREGPISFLPSYKYDVGTVSLFDSSEKKRAPSWCDRILYRTRKDKSEYDKKVLEEKKAHEKDEEMKSRGLDQDEDVLFSYDPEADGEELQGATEPDLGYDEYDETEDNDLDKVVTKEGFVDRIKLDIYTSHQRIMSSDHKPIISLFTLEYDAVVPELKAKIHAEVARELDRAENEGRPTVTVVIEGSQASTESAVDFGDVAFLQRKSCLVTVANTGSVPADLSFIDKPTTDEDDFVQMTWLSTSFISSDNDTAASMEKSITLEPGQTVLAHIEAHVATISDLRDLNDGHVKLEDVLVLRVEGGRDHFVPVRGTWLPTCFGRSVEELIRVPDGGIRKFLAENDLRGAIPEKAEVRCSAPKELFKLTEAIQTLSERCVADEAMLEDMVLPRESGWPFDASTWSAGLEEQDSIKAEIATALDTDSPISEAIPVELSSIQKLELLSSVLLLFLASLTDGLFPPQLWSKFSTELPDLISLPQAAWPDAKAHILDMLSSAPNHNIAFVFLTSTLSRVATELTPTTSEPLLPGIGRRMGFRRGEDDSEKRRKLRQRKYADIIAPLAFRTKDRDKAAKERERIVLEIFLSREAES